MERGLTKWRQIHWPNAGTYSSTSPDPLDPSAELGVADQVTTFTASDFGRTLRSNGRGSDHAWGGNALVMGGAVQGGRIYGEYPEALLLNDGLDVGTNGRLLPTTSCDAYFCELLRWFGIPAGEMQTVLPNIEAFYDPQSAQPPLGFLQV